MQTLKPIEGDSLPTRIVNAIGTEAVAYFLMISGSISFAAGHIYANQRNFHPTETTLIRGITVAVISFLLTRYKGSSLNFDSYNLKILVTRNSIMVFQGLAYAAAQFYLPMPIAISLNSCSPIFIFIYDYFLYGVSINRYQFVGVIISIIGVILTVYGPYLMKIYDPEHQGQSNFDNYKTNDPIVQAIAGFTLLFAILCHGYGVLMTKKLKKIDSLQINFVLGVMLALTASLLVPPFSQISADKAHPRPLSLGTYLVGFLTMGIPMCYGQIAYIAAIILTKHMGVCTLLSFSTIIFGYLLSIFRYEQPLNLFCVFGSTFIILGISQVIMQKTIAK